VVYSSYIWGFHNISSSRARWCVRNPVVLTDSITRVLFSLFICSASPHRRARRAYTYNPMFLRRFNQIKPCQRKSASAPRHAAAVFGRRDAQNLDVSAIRGLTKADVRYIDTEDLVTYPWGIVDELLKRIVSHLTTICLLQDAVCE